MPEMGNPLAIPLAITRTSGVTPKCWCPKYCPVRPESGLHLVEDQEDAMLARALGNAGEEFGVGGDVATLAEHRLDDHRRDLARGGGRREQVVELL